MRLKDYRDYDVRRWLVGAADVTGDGWPDLVSYDIDDLIIHHGPLFRQLDPGDSDVRIRFDWARFDPPGFKSRTERQVKLGADFNADGVQDMLVNTGYDIHVVHGPVCGGYQEDVRDVAAASLAPNLFNRKRTDARPEFAGDFNGDGYHDLAVVRRFDDGRDDSRAGEENTVFAFFGGREALWSYDDPDGTAVPANARVDLLVKVPGPAGDLNDDGYDELVVNVHEKRLHVAWGPMYGRQVLQPVGADEFMWATVVDGRHDLTGDGRADLLVDSGRKNLFLYPGL